MRDRNSYREKPERGQPCDCAILERAMQPEVSLLLTPPPLTQSRCIGTPPLPEQIELHRDRMWRRDEDVRIESAVDAERLIKDVGFANTLPEPVAPVHRSDIAVCWRRDVSLRAASSSAASK